MESLSFTPGRAFLSSDSPTVPWSAVFEDEGIAGYFYACDRSWRTQEESILDAVLIYNVSSLPQPVEGRLAAIQWSRDGLRAVLYLDGSAQAMFDFAAREGYSRSNFPNFMEQSTDRWRKTSHAWEDARLQQFEAELYR
jgi:hypothetical protein